MRLGKIYLLAKFRQDIPRFKTHFAQKTNERRGPHLGLASLDHGSGAVSLASLGRGWWGLVEGVSLASLGRGYGLPRFARSHFALGRSLTLAPSPNPPQKENFLASLGS